MRPITGRGTCVPSDPVQRILPRLEFEPNSGCWLWTGAMNEAGYGNVAIKTAGRWRPIRVHRALFEAQVGPIPEGLDLLHNCDTPLCCNPDHMKVGTHAENMHDMARRGRSGRRHQQGHKLTPSERDLIRNLSIPGDRDFGHRALARKFGVTASAICYLTTGRGKKA